MSKRGHTSLKKITKKLIIEIQSHPLFMKRMREIKRVVVSKEYDIPYLAGYSNDAKTIYVDRHLKTRFEGHDIIPFLKVHEICEKAVMDIENWDYQQAHHIATHYERMAVESAGLNWKRYCEFLKPYIKRVSSEKLTKVPKDLDLEPYFDERDKNILTSLKKAVNIKAVVRKTIKECLEFNM